LFTSPLVQAECPTELAKSHLLGKISNPTKFFTPIRNYCSDDILNVFSNCIETSSSQKTIFFGTREKHYEDQKQAQCPFGYANEVRGGYLRFQKLNGRPVCLDPCESVAIGKFFRDEEKFGTRKALNIGDTVYIPELKGLSCGNKKHEGCVKVSHFIEYTNDRVIDIYSGTCSSTITRGQCNNSKDSNLPEVVSIYKVNTSVKANSSNSQLSLDTEEYLLNIY
jgi:hypothetical protein